MSGGGAYDKFDLLCSKNDDPRRNFLRNFDLNSCGLTAVMHSGVDKLPLIFNSFDMN
jgi:hypothetical protein